MVPLSVGASGLLTAYVGGPIGLSLNLLCLYIHGMGVGLCPSLCMNPLIVFVQADFVLNPIAVYNLDVAQIRSTEIIASCVSVLSWHGWQTLC
jgi:hypothetical protein